MTPELNLVVLDDHGRPFLVLAAHPSAARPPDPGTGAAAGPESGTVPPAATTRERGGASR